jgi:hypothetical protein
MKTQKSITRNPLDRRSFMRGSLAAGGAAAIGVGLLSSSSPAFGQD